MLRPRHRRSWHSRELSEKSIPHWQGRSIVRREIVHFLAPLDPRVDVSGFQPAGPIAWEGARSRHLPCERRPSDGY